MIWDKIAVMCPTYGRAKTLLPTFVTSCIATAKHVDRLRFAFCVNDGDADTIKYINEFPWPNKEHVVVVYENLPKPNLAVFFNMLYDATKEFGDDCVVTMLGDDMSFESRCWDTAVLNLVNSYKGVGVFWCNDAFIAREKLCVNMFVTRKMVDATGKKFMDEDFAADMVDYLWYHVGKMTRSLHFLPNITIKHNHNTAKPKEQWDATFNRLRPAQKEGHAVGKEVALAKARVIAGTLMSRGFIGDNQG